MKKLTATTLFAMGLFAQLQATDLFTPVQKTDLRLPSVPLITSDPYLSIWSPYDKLNEGTTRHWTNDEKSLIGAVRVDGKVYRFMGKQALESLLPMAGSEEWEGNYTFDAPQGEWTAVNYNAEGWKKGKGAFGTNDMPVVRTSWNTKDIWVRREFNLNDAPADTPIYLKYSHDDVFELYLNGEKLVATDYSWKNNVVLELSDKVRAKMREGKNVIAAHCHNTTGGAYVDFGLYTTNKETAGFENIAIQKSVDVLPTQTYYTFTCGPVELDVVFTAPMLIDDLDLISTPINYISYQATSTDKKNHDVQVYIETTPQLTINEMTQPTRAQVIKKNGISYVQAGSIDQPITGRKGDLICIDWGYAYLAGNNGANTSVSLGDYVFKACRSASSSISLPAVSIADSRVASVCR